MTDNVLKAPAFKLKGRLYTFTVIQLLHTNIKQFAKQLDEVIATAPRLFDNTPVVLDCSAIQEGEVDLDALFQCMRTHSIVPVGIQNANPLLTILAQTRGMAVLHGSSAHDKALFASAEVKTAAPPPPSPAEIVATKIQTTPVRSGQQVVSMDGDLIVTAAVSHGAELLADGNIHVYGSLRGRALAGISGDRNARIFCLALEAELLSIAGVYCLSDAIEPHAGPCQIYLHNERICIEPLC